MDICDCNCTVKYKNNTKGLWIMTTKIDFVLPWVDSNDLKWQEKKKKYSPKESWQSSEERYRDYGILKIFFRSVEKYAPWVNKIYLITDGQIPDWLDSKHKKIEVIDHKQIIPSRFLPTFNSSVIEMSINNIKDLENCFVFFNDDMFLNSETHPSDFFVNDKPKDFRVYNPIIPHENFDNILFNNVKLINEWINKHNSTNKNGIFSLKYGKYNIKNLILHRSNNVPGYINPHLPLALTRDSLSKAEGLWKEDIELTKTHKFRSNEDINIWLVRYLNLELGQFIPNKINSGKFFVINQIKDIKNALKTSKYKLLCINDSENISNYNEVTIVLEKALKSKFPDKSSFELG